ncbi:uncharacterized protein LOC101891262 isoform X2 [Musca domestica]|uniref:Uncharacterized protein LOC101891262 isoform X2 n=1 Tax=Musca domestica TaxID=7370 RepID=A0ABM3V8Y5_MUSDO|nr:uncharacterized protein LOC101891262 isoform X2 [Musca domestica]
MTNQLTLLFLVVVISGALCTVEDYVIMSQCAHNKAIYLAAEGTVSVTDISQTQNITIVGRPDFVNEDFKIALYAKETQRYLCFNDHWKLVGMKELQDTCYFNEAIVHGYFVFSSVVDRRRRIGFTQRGRAVGPKKVVNDACYMFTKIPTDQFFHQHNQFFQQQQRVRATTARAPQSEEHLGSGMGRGSGSGSGRPNRHRNQHRNEDSSNRQQQHGKKSKLHSSGAGQGTRKRQHQQQRLQQMRGGGDSKNSTYLSSSRQHNVELGQYGAHNNHSGKHHNHSQPQYSHHHAARHHHSSSSNDSRRHHHYEQKQKSRAHHNRMRTSPSTAAATTTTSTTSTTLMSTMPSKSSMAPNSTTRTTTIASTSLADVPPVPSEQGTFPTSSTSTTTTTMASHHDSLSTSMGHKHKGRRRKAHRKHGLHKSQTQSQGSNTQHDISPESSAATEETAEEDEDLTTDFSTWPQLELTSAQDFPGSVKPTSASLPSWETWYPSSVSTATFEQESSSDYAFSSISSKEPKEEGYKKLGVSVSSPLPLNYDISPGTMSLPYPAPTTTTAAFPASSLVRQEDPPKSNDLLPQNTSKQTEAKEQQQRLEDEMNNEFKLHLAGNTSSSSLNQSEEQDSSSEEVEETSAPDDNEDEAIASTMASKLSDVPELTVTSTNNLMTDYIYATRTVPLTGNHKVSRHRHSHEPARHPHNAMQHHKDKLALQQKIRLENGLITTPNTSTTTTTTASSFAANPSTSQATLGANSKHVPQSLNTFSDLESSLPEITANTLSSTTTRLITAMPTLATAMSPSSSSSTPSSSTITSPSQTTTRKTLRKSTQKLLATPFHQLTYVRNEAGEIDIDSLDNISMYPDLEDNENVNGDGEMQPHHRTTSRFTMISGYHHQQQQQHHPSTAAATSALPESIRIAKIKINRERKRMLRLRNIGGYNA